MTESVCKRMSICTRFMKLGCPMKAEAEEPLLPRGDYSNEGCGAFTRQPISEERETGAGTQLAPQLGAIAGATNAPAPPMPPLRGGLRAWTSATMQREGGRKNA